MEKVLAMLKGGTTSFAVVITRELEVLSILEGGANKFRVGHDNFYLVLRGRAQKVSDP